MKRGIRRHQQNVARVRLVRVLWSFWGPESRAMEKPWRAVNKFGAYMMRDPGWWTRERVLRPARIRSNCLIREVERGIDPDLLEWPDYRKPEIYYW